MSAPHILVIPTLNERRDLILVHRFRCSTILSDGDPSLSLGMTTVIGSLP